MASTEEAPASPLARIHPSIRPVASITKAASPPCFCWEIAMQRHCGLDSHITQTATTSCKQPRRAVPRGSMKGPNALSAPKSSTPLYAIGYRSIDHSLRYLPRAGHGEILRAWKRRLSDPVVKAGNPVVIGPFPEYTVALPRLLVFADRRNDPTLVDRSRDDGVVNIDREVRAIAKRTNTPYISMLDTLCASGTCEATTPSGEPLQFDYGHLTAQGSIFVSNAILSTIEKFPEAQNPKFQYSR